MAPLVRPLASLSLVLALTTPALAQSPTPAPAAGDALAKDGQPLAGWHDGLFYLRDPNDDFRLYVQGRAQIDSYSYFGPGVADTTLKSTVFLRRARVELTGEILRDFSFSIAGDWGATVPVDNATGTNEVRAASPGQTPTADTARYASAQTAGLRAQATDVWINYGPLREVNVQVGQFDAPFTLENRTSDKFLPFMERSLAVRSLGIPANKELGAMLWGEPASRLVHYAVAVVDGDGMNRPSVDNRADVYARAFSHPLALAGGPLAGAQLGGSFHYGVRDPAYVFYDYAPMTTQAGYGFFSPVYRTNASGVDRWVHVLPSGTQLAAAAELRVPVWLIDLTAEYVAVKNGTREAYEGEQAIATRRAGTMRGSSYYVELGFWPLGNRDINGLPGYEKLPHVDFTKTDTAPKRALQLLVKWEQLHLDYASASRAGAPDAKGIDGETTVNALSFGANYWVTKHLRFSADWVIDMFPGSSGTPSHAQRARAPGNTLDPAVYAGRDAAHLLHEVTLRAAIAL